MRRLRGYWECPPHFEECTSCGEFRMCRIFQSEREEETGYADEVAYCEECAEKENIDGS